MNILCLAVIENMMEFRPEMSAEAAQQGLMQWLLKRIRVSMKFKIYYRPPDKTVNKNQFSSFSTKIYCGFSKEPSL